MPWKKVLDDYTGGNTVGGRSLIRGLASVPVVVEGTLGGTLIQPRAVLALDGVEVIALIQYKNRASTGYLLTEFTTEGLFIVDGLGGANALEFHLTGGGAAVNLNIWSWEAGS